MDAFQKKAKALKELEPYETKYKAEFDKLWWPAKCCFAPELVLAFSTYLRFNDRAGYLQARANWRWEYRLVSRMRRQYKEAPRLRQELYVALQKLSGSPAGPYHPTDPWPQCLEAAWNASNRDKVFSRKYSTKLYATILLVIRRLMKQRCQHNYELLKQPVASP